MAQAFNNPAVHNRDRRPDASGMFVDVRNGCWHVTYRAMGGEQILGEYNPHDSIGLRHMFSMWNVRTVRTSSSVDSLPAELLEILDAALAWS